MPLQQLPEPGRQRHPQPQRRRRGERVLHRAGEGVPEQRTQDEVLGHATLRTGAGATRVRRSSGWFFQRLDAVTYCWTLSSRRLGLDWKDHLLDPEYWNRVPRHSRRGALGGAPLAEGAPGPLRARARARASARDGLSPDELRAVEGLLDLHA